MTFLNWTMLLGLAAVSVPIVIHLLNRRQARRVEWGAMQFLRASLASRNRRILIEEIILMAIRCLWIALVALALARPFAPSRSAVPWALVVPAVLIAAVLAALAGAMWRQRRVRWRLLGVAGVLLLLAVGTSVYERIAQGRMWTVSGGEKDVAIVIDASESMRLKVAGRSNFPRAVDDARAVVAACRPADAISITLAGSVPRQIVGAPTADRQAVADALNAAEPIGGAMRTLDALNAAVASLAEGHNPGKKIVLITDAQRVGWDLSAEARWRFFAEGAADLPTPPELIVRTLPLPEKFINASVAEVTLSRPIVGADRAVGIDVKVANTGAEPIDCDGVELRIDGEYVDRLDVGRVQPDAAETVRFRHRFTEPGRRRLTLELLVDDDMPGDDTAERVVNVVDSLPVLLVDGAPSLRPLEGAAAFVNVALAPRSTDPEAPATNDNSTDTKPSDDLRYLVKPQVIPAPDIRTVESFAPYRLVVLADVATLPEATARSLVDFVRSGGGVLVCPGGRVRPEFYNNWISPAGAIVSPATLTERRAAAATPVRLSLKTFSHPALQVVADQARSDADDALVRAYWQLAADEKDPDVRVAGRLETGEPLLVERSFGKGFVLMSAFSLNRSDTNLPTQKCFVPLVHELAYYLAAARGDSTNVEPGSEVTVALTRRDEDRTGKGDAPYVAGAAAEVLTPDGERRPAGAATAGDRLRLSFAGTDRPGRYRFVLPAYLHHRYVSKDDPAEGVPFVVVRAAAESRLAALTAGELEGVGKHVSVRRADSSDELTSALAGGVPGEELWKVLAIAALAALIAEIALTRWIAARRRTHRVETVSFGEELSDAAGYRARARQMLRSGEREEATVGS